MPTGRAVAGLAWRYRGLISGLGVRRMLTTQPDGARWSSDLERVTLE
jgi:hypothetical protein